MSSEDMTSDWRKASYSNGTGSCVEVGQAARNVLVRDTTQHGRGPVLSVPAVAWRRLLTDVRTGKLA
jgi:hypothetical protein